MAPMQLKINSQINGIKAKINDSRSKFLAFLVSFSLYHTFFFPIKNIMRTEKMIQWIEHTPHKDDH